MAAHSNNFTLIPRQRFRRSNRRFHTAFEGRESIDVATLGQFKALPPEIFHMILKYLSVTDISMLSMVSKAISCHIISYISTPSGSRSLLLQNFHNADFPEGRRAIPIVEHYRSLGNWGGCSLRLLFLFFQLLSLGVPVNLINSAKLGASTSIVLNFMVVLLLCIALAFPVMGHFYRSMTESGVPVTQVAVVCPAIGSKILTAGWDELECHRVFNFLCDLINLHRKVQSLVSKKPGSTQKLELRLRLFCRNVLLDHWTHRSDSAFWLTRLLKPWPMVNQAHLLYLFFGPVSTIDGHVAWLKMAEVAVDEASLKGLADAIKLLYNTEAKEWTADDIISLVDELSVVPREWLLENNARLLILCGNTICFTFMASKAVNGRTMELANIVVHLALVCEKDLYCMDWAVKMMLKVCEVFGTHLERSNFLQNVENAFARIALDMLQSVISGDHNEEDSSFLNLFHLINAQANFHKEVLYTTLSSSSK